MFVECLYCALCFTRIISCDPPPPQRGRYYDYLRFTNGKLGYNVAKKITQSRPAGKWQDQDLNLEGLKSPSRPLAPVGPTPVNPARQEHQGAERRLSATVSAYGRGQAQNNSQTGDRPDEEMSGRPLPGVALRPGGG